MWFTFCHHAPYESARYSLTVCTRMRVFAHYGMYWPTFRRFSTYSASPRRNRAKPFLRYHFIILLLWCCSIMHPFECEDVTEFDYAKFCVRTNNKSVSKSIHNSWMMALFATVRRGKKGGEKKLESDCQWYKLRMSTWANIKSNSSIRTHRPSSSITTSTMTTEKFPLGISTGERVRRIHVIQFVCLLRRIGLQRAGAAK